MAEDTFTEADVLAIIAEGDEDAYDLLMAKLPDAERRFKAVDKALRDFLARVREVFPDAQYYTASGGFHLLLGSSHDVRAMHAQRQLVALSGRARISDGDW